jgi:hypothetical protein
MQELMISLRYCTTCKTAWKALTAAAGIVGRLRPYDLRHTAITDILQIPDVSEETAKSIAGHISSQILKTYSHVRIEAKRAALDALVKRTCGSVGGGRHPFMMFSDPCCPFSRHSPWPAVQGPLTIPIGTSN